MHGNHKGGVKRILNSAISTVDHCYWRVTFELCIQFETAIVSDHTSHYFKIFKLHLNIFPISEPTVTEPQLYYIWTMDHSHLNRLLSPTVILLCLIPVITLYPHTIIYWLVVCAFWLVFPHSPQQQVWVSMDIRWKFIYLQFVHVCHVWSCRQPLIQYNCDAEMVVWIVRWNMGTIVNGYLKCYLVHMLI